MSERSVRLGQYAQRVDDWENGIKVGSKLTAKEAWATIERLQDALTEAREALTPFVAAKPCPGAGDDRYVLHVAGEDLRRAKAVVPLREAMAGAPAQPEPQGEGRGPLTAEEAEAVLRRLKGIARCGDRFLIAHAQTKLTALAASGEGGQGSSPEPLTVERLAQLIQTGAASPRAAFEIAAEALLAAREGGQGG